MTSRCGTCKHYAEHQHCRDCESCKAAHVSRETKRERRSLFVSRETKADDAE